MVNNHYFDIHCLDGYYDVSIVLQFQSRKTIHQLRILTVLMFVFYLGLFVNCALFTAYCHSIRLNLQSNCIHAKNFRYPYRRIRRHFMLDTCLAYRYLCFMLYTWLFLIILLAGDISENPGSGTESSSSSDSTNDTLELSLFENHFSVVHYIIQSLLHKVDQLQVELSHVDVIALSETWLNPSVRDEYITFHNYQKPFRKDRGHNNYGGIVVYVKDNISCKRRLDLEIDRIECIWLEISLKSKSVLLGLFYRPPNTPASVLDDIETSIDLAFDTNISNIIITGDFNLNYLIESSRRKIMSVFQPYNLKQLIQEPTHITELSSSLIDLIATNVEHNVIYAGVGESILEQNIRYHCPVFSIFDFDKHKQPCFKWKIWKFDNGDYDLLNRLIRNFDWSTIENDDINVYAENFTNKLLELSERSIPNKVVTIRPSDPPWVNNSLRNAIRKRKRAHK